MFRRAPKSPYGFRGVYNVSRATFLFRGLGLAQQQYSTRTIFKRSCQSACTRKDTYVSRVHLVIHQRSDWCRLLSPTTNFGGFSSPPPSRYAFLSPNEFERACVRRRRRCRTSPSPPRARPRLTQEFKRWRALGWRRPTSSRCVIYKRFNFSVPLSRWSGGVVMCIIRFRFSLECSLVLYSEYVFFCVTLRLCAPDQ